MSVLNFPLSGLAWLGRQGTRAVAALVVIGIAVPPVGAALRPFVPEAVFFLLCTSFLRVDVAALRGYVRRPGLVIAATLWSSVAIPLLFVAGGRLGGADTEWPGLYLGLLLHGVTMPMMSAPAFAALMGLDATLVLVTLVACSAVTPFTAPLFVHLFGGGALSLSPLDLGLKLLMILTGAMLTAAVLRRFLGLERVRRFRDEIDGLNIVMLFVFVAAVMGNVAESFVARPLMAAALTILAFVVFFAILGGTMLLLARARRERAFALGFMAAQRNLGLMLAATGGAVPELTWLYFALSQFPIYLSPIILKPLV